MGELDVGNGEEKGWSEGDTLACLEGNGQRRDSGTAEFMIFGVGGSR